MPAELSLLNAPARLWRVERTESPLRFSEISPADDLADRSGNRYDVLGAGVLYAASDPTGAFAETLSAFRPSARTTRLLAERPEDPGMVNAAVVPERWRTARRLRSFALADSLPFVDIESTDSHTYLTRHASDVLLERGMANLDVAMVRGPSRLLTRGLSRWIYTQTNAQGGPLYAGIRYVSRLGDFECWAIFDGSQIQPISDDAIEIAHPALQAIGQSYGIEIN